MPTISPQGLAFIAQWESLRLEPYLCPAGRWTVGYGHVLRDGEPREPITAETAEAYLLQDTAIAADALCRLVDQPLLPHQFDALVSFIYNVGVNAFRGSTMRRVLNAGEYAAAAAEFPRWVFSNGQRSRGLERRRAAEQRLFVEGVYDIA